MTTKLYWAGKAPTECDICHDPIDKVFIDGATRSGPWGNMCPSCSRVFGIGLGTGRGQLYTRQDNGRYMKTAG